MDGINLSAFREPRGVMRVLHFVFSICAFATISGYSGSVTLQCPEGSPVEKDFSYPFNLQLNFDIARAKQTCAFFIVGPFSSDAKFFVATGVLAMLYALAIAVVYIKFDELYKSNNQLPLIDFVLTVVFGVLWLSSSAAWANSLSGLKSVTNPTLAAECNGCRTYTGNFNTLNISVIFGFLNFFLWAADLWFLYKETAWFQGNQQQAASSGV